MTTSQQFDAVRTVFPGFYVDRSRSGQYIVRGCPGISLVIAGLRGFDTPEEAVEHMHAALVSDPCYRWEVNRFVRVDRAIDSWEDNLHTVHLSDLRADVLRNRT
jgi:hypothetical protein